jgi:hypothetical protein
MSCLYSSPEVSSVELLVLKSIALKLQALKPQALDCRRHRRLADRARLTRDLIAVQFDSKQIFPYVAVSKDAFPTLQRTPLAASVIPPAKTGTGFSRGFSSAISGFRSLCGQGSAAL